jgi:hypothetical protein
MHYPKDDFINRTGILGAICILLFVAVSCMKDRPEELPQHLVWNPELAFPLSKDTFGLNAESGFDTSLFELDTITGLPDWFEEDTIYLEGFMDFGVSSLLNNLENINRILLRVNIYNQFPHEVYSQAYFVDDAMNYIDSIFHEGPETTGPGQVNKDGSVTPAHSRKDAVFDRERVFALGSATSVYFRAGFFVSDVDSTLIPYYRDFEYIVDMGAMVDLITEF